MDTVAIFVRVSTTKQDHSRQVSELQSYAEKQGYHVVAVITEQISGAAKNEDRKGIKELYRLVETKQITKVLVHEISRLGRNPSQILQILEDFTAAKVSIFSYNMGLETLTPQKKLNPAVNLIFMILGEIARQERELLRERIISGVAEARRKGKVLGRRAGSVESEEAFMKKYPQAVRRLKEGHTLRNTAALANVSVNTARKLKELLNKKQLTGMC